METCRWCMALDENDVVTLLQHYCTGNLTAEEIRGADKDLQFCPECVVEYHKAREKVPQLHKRLWKLETNRLCKVFNKKKLNTRKEDLECFIDDGQEHAVSPEVFHNELSFPLKEVLRYPYLLCHRDLCNLVVNALCTMEEMKHPLMLYDKYQGIYLLMVHPNEKVRRWALNTARSLGRVDIDSYYDLKEVFSCMFYMIDLGITLDIPEDDSMGCWSGRMQRLPPHLYDSKNQKNYWLGISMVLMQLDSQAMDSLFLGPDKQACIPQCIINTMLDCKKDDCLATNSFWPALHCFMIILDRLGSKIWGQVEPLDAFQAISRSPCYEAELESIRQKSAGSSVKKEPERDDDPVTCSQMVYDCYAKERKQRSSDWLVNQADNGNNLIFEEMNCLVNLLQSDMGQGMRVYGSTFLWFIPFVTSIMELSEFHTLFIGEIFHYLEENLNKHVLSGQTYTCDKVTEFFVRILVDIINLHLAKGFINALSFYSHVWLKVVVQCATLSADICSGMMTDLRTGSCRVSSTTSGFDVVNRSLMSGVGPMRQACMKLIRHLLREGSRIGTVTESAHFLHLLNRHMQQNPTGEWKLSKSESEDLQSCLKKHLKAVKVNDVPCALPTLRPDPPKNLASSSNFTTEIPMQRETKDVETGPSNSAGVCAIFKNEPLWQHDTPQQDFCDDLEGIVLAKKEDLSQIPISEFKPSTELNVMKPDFGKIQMIKSKLNDKQNILKIQEITQRNLDSKSRCSSSSKFELNSGSSTIQETRISDYKGCIWLSDDDDDDDDDEPLDVRRRRLKRFRSTSDSDKDSDTGQTSCKHNIAEMNNKSQIITISSDDEIRTRAEELNQEDHHIGKAVNKPLNSNLNECTGRDFDDLSESQVFEFETQEDVASVWQDAHADGPIVTKKCKFGPSISHDEKTGPLTLAETQPVREEDIDVACRQAEEESTKQAPLQKLTIPKLLKPPKSNIDNFKPKPVPSISTSTIASLGDRKRQCSGKKPVLIEALAQNNRRNNRSLSTKSHDQEKPNSSTIHSPPIIGPSSIPGSSRFTSGSVSSASRPLPTPAIVPPKKVRKPIESKSVAERLGLRKKERIAFDLSQRSLDCLDELRSHGQNMHVERQPKSKKVCRNSKPQQKLAQKVGKKLLGSQDMQYFRQSRGMVQKATAAAVPLNTIMPPELKGPVHKVIPNPKSALEVEESSEDEYALPCSQPDPARRTASEKLVSEPGSNKSYESSKALFGNNSLQSSSSGAVKNDDLSVQHADAKERSGVNDRDDEWMTLTQNEPTDMELCSQMDEMEQDCGIETFSIAPVEMNIQPNNYDAGMGVPDKPLLAVVSQKKLPAVLPQDHLFLKPNIPPPAQNKPKPLTTKVYTSSSRNASLALEIEKAPNPLSAANVAKSKMVRQSTATLARSVQKPIGDVGQSVQARPVLQPSNQVPKSVWFNPVTYVSNPSYQSYSRPVEPIAARKVSENQSLGYGNPQMFDPANLKRAVLKWEYRMLDNYKMFGPPDDLSPYPLREVPTSFSSYEDYYNTLYPLLLYNAFEEIANEWLNAKRTNLDLSVWGLEYSNRIASAQFTARLSPQQEMRQLYPKEDDLVLLWLPENSGAYAKYEPISPGISAHFGWVLKSNVYSNGGGQPSTLKLTIQTRGNVSSINSQPIRCEMICSLVSTQREFRALCLLRENTMVQPLFTSDIRLFTPCQDNLPSFNMPEYNKDQIKAIGYGVAMVKKTTRTPKILLIHGPPGTGKTKTIVGLLHKLLTDSSSSTAANRYTRSRRMRILVCAPSNAAIDNLMKKIILLFKEKCKNRDNPQGNSGDINLVRLGNERTISRDLKPFGLDCQVKNRAEKAQQRLDVDFRSRKEELSQIIERLSQQCVKMKHDKNMAEFERLNAQKLEYSKERERLVRQLNERREKRQEIQSRLLHDAHVICCTLSTSGSIVLESAFRRLGHEPFSCVIIDEAGQAKETETLIPLFFKCPSLILVGDPEQLPPTVVSQKAKDLGYDQSLMARVWKHLHRLSTSTPCSVFLSVQYRMHPDICEFPSKYIYENNLKSDCEMAQTRCSATWPFEPYRVFDVTDGQELREGDSFSNHKEVKLVLLLVKLLREKTPMRIGVITPYNAQKRRILEALSKEVKCRQVEVDTVDGFQGREMECIIVSCVRASGGKGSIGFVGNRQRMNVTITRAKFSLFILGHIRTLKDQSDWGALIDDAAKRGTIISTSENKFRDDTMKVLKPIRIVRSLSHPSEHTGPSRHPEDSGAAGQLQDPRLFRANHEWDRGTGEPSNSRQSHNAPDHRHNQNYSSETLPRRRDRRYNSTSTESSSRHREQL